VAQFSGSTILQRAAENEETLGQLVKFLRLRPDAGRLPREVLIHEFLEANPEITGEALRRAVEDATGRGRELRGRESGANPNMLGD
jgi:hypothetical protein